MAPAKAVFYDKKWKVLGTKRDLSVQIKSITSIDRFLLEGLTELYLY